MIPALKPSKPKLYFFRCVVDLFYSILSNESCNKLKIYSKSYNKYALNIENPQQVYNILTRQGFVQLTVQFVV